MKKYFVKKDHPFHRVSTGDVDTLKFEDIKTNARDYYRDNFFVNEFTFIMLTRLGNPSDTIAIAD